MVGVCEASDLPIAAAPGSRCRSSADEGELLGLTYWLERLATVVWLLAPLQLAGLRLFEKASALAASVEQSLAFEEARMLL